MNKETRKFCYGIFVVLIGLYILPKEINSKPSLMLTLIAMAIMVEGLIKIKKTITDDAP